MTTPKVPGDAHQEPLPQRLAECIANAQDRCKDMRFALQAYSGLENLLTLARFAEPEQCPLDHASVAALLQLITDQARDRLEAAIDAVGEVSAEVAMRRARH
jgi:hypothetical protein